VSVFLQITLLNQLTDFYEMWNGGYTTKGHHNLLRVTFYNT